MPDLFDSHLYPAVALDRNVERNVIAKLEIGPDGSVTSCSAPGHFGYPQFVDAACKVLKTRAHFEPARDASGKVVAAPYVLIIAFRMRGF